MPALMGFLSIFGIGNNRIKKILQQGATIIDVRIAAEFDQGRVPDSFNIPIDRIQINLERIRQMRRPIILCSNSESEADQAVSLLKANGITDLYNGGNWTRLLKITRSM